MANKLSERATLVHLRVARWAGSRRDSETSETFRDQLGVEEDAGYWVTNFIPAGKLDTLKKRANKVHSIWVKRTLPWMHGGTRIIRNTRLMALRTEMTQAINEYYTEAQRFVTDDYPGILRDMPDRLKSLLNGKTMPTGDELLRKFRIRWDIQPVPDVDSASMSDLLAEEADQIRQQARASMNDMTQDAMSEIWRQFALLIGKIQKRLSDPEAKFKDSLIENLREFCQLLPNITLVDDTSLEQMRQEVTEKLANIDPQDLRDNVRYRKSTAQKAKTVLNTIVSTRKIDLAFFDDGDKT